MFVPAPRSKIYGSLKHDLYAIAVSLGWLGQDQKGTERLTRKLESLFDRSVVLVPQARVGVFLAIKQLIKSGQVVLLSPYTIYDVVNMVICAGGKPRFVDVDPVTCNMSTGSLAQRIQTENVGAVLLTHLHGFCANSVEVSALCNEYGVPLIEDCAQCFGAKQQDKLAGTFGEFGVFSMGVAKNVNALYGGFIVAKSPRHAAELLEEIESFPEFSRVKLRARALFCLVGRIAGWRPAFASLTFWLLKLGQLKDIEILKNVVRGEMEPELRSTIPPDYLTRLSNLQATIAEPQIDVIEQHAEQRREIASVYHEGLSDIDDLIIPPLASEQNICMAYPIQTRDRLDLLEYLLRNNVDVAIQHLQNTAEAACFADYYSDCSNASVVSKEVLLLPIYPGYPIKHAQRNVRLIKAYLTRRRSALAVT